MKISRVNLTLSAEGGGHKMPALILNIYNFSNMYSNAIKLLDFF